MHDRRTSTATQRLGTAPVGQDRVRSSRVWWTDIRWLWVLCTAPLLALRVGVLVYVCYLQLVRPEFRFDVLAYVVALAASAPCNACCMFISTAAQHCTSILLG